MKFANIKARVAKAIVLVIHVQTQMAEKERVNLGNARHYVSSYNVDAATSLDGEQAVMIGKCFKYIIFSFAVVSSACRLPEDPHAPSKETLEQLLSERATRTRVEDVLGKEYTWYERGTPSWDALRNGDDPEDVRKAIQIYPKLMFYTTMWQRTWIFLDDDDIVQAYFFGSQ
jgi:hypothetical protein